MNWIENYMADAERLIMDNRVEEGLGILNNLLFEEPGNSNLHNHLGWAYLYYQNDIARAQLHFTVAMKFDAAFAPPYLHMGNLFNRLGRYTEATDYFKHGLNLPGANRLGLLEGLALAHEMKKEFRLAIKFYKEAIAASTGFEMNHLRASISRCRTKRWVLLLN
jgi:tetratricopeptide (TPR) repeat protein